MKIAKLILAFALILFLASCVEINEDITINKNGSGEWAMKMDMSKLLEIMQNYVGKEEMEKQLPQKKMDTSLLIKSIVDTSTSISAEKKALLRDGKIHMDLNLDEKVFKTDMHFPFKSPDDLQKIYTAVGDGSLGTGQLLNNLGPSNGDSSGAQQKGPDLGQFNSMYNFTSRDGFISRTVNEEKFKALKASPEIAQMKQAADMGMEVPYTVTIHLPRPAKKITNTFATVSADKRTVTLKYNLTDVFDHPEKFEYTIEY